MPQIRPVSDLSSRFHEIETTVSRGEPVFLTQNGYGSMVILSMEQYTALTSEADYIETKLDEADRAAEASDVRYSHEEVFSRIRAGI
jgi:PHD/YefM family antitoxin component YafN of YafNO toxin-antitoxin module